MKAPKQKSPVRALVVVAHPDDETLFMGGTILRHKNWRWTIVSVTGGGALGREKERAAEFRKACKRLGAAEGVILGLKDQPRQRISQKLIAQRLRSLRDFDVVFTHNAYGDYGHPHHADVGLAVFNRFQATAPVYSFAWHMHPDIVTNLTAAEYDMKRKIMLEIYGAEVRRYNLKTMIFAWEGFVEMQKQFCKPRFTPLELA